MPASPETMLAQLRGPGHRRALGRAITLLESDRAEDRAAAAALVDHLDALPTPAGFRIGVSGTPGVGKSTFVEQFGLRLVEQGRRLAVLAIDPSSQLSRGSILGDKTRMETLSRHPEVFIRPSPNAGTLGGVSSSSRAAILLCEAAGYDRILVETVGVGQAEWQVHSMTDCFILLTQPAAGDDLQGIKRGILELADIILVNKTDILPREAGETTRQLRQSLHLAPPRDDGWTVPVLEVSAVTGAGLDDLLTTLANFREVTNITDRRLAQRTDWMREAATEAVRWHLHRILGPAGQPSDSLRRIIDEGMTISRGKAVILGELARSLIHDPPPAE